VVNVDRWKVANDSTELRERNMTIVAVGSRLQPDRVTAVFAVADVYDLSGRLFTDEQRPQFDIKNLRCLSLVGRFRKYSMKLYVIHSAHGSTSTG